MVALQLVSVPYTVTVRDMSRLITHLIVLKDTTTSTIGTAANVFLKHIMIPVLAYVSPATLGATFVRIAKIIAYSASIAIYLSMGNAFSTTTPTPLWGRATAAIRHRKGASDGPVTPVYGTAISTTTNSTVMVLAPPALFQYLFRG